MTPYQFSRWKQKMRKEDTKRLMNCEGYASKNSAWWYEGGYETKFWWRDETNG